MSLPISTTIQRIIFSLALLCAVVGVGFAVTFAADDSIRKGERKAPTLAPQGERGSGGNFPNILSLVDAWTSTASTITASFPTDQVVRRIDVGGASIYPVSSTGGPSGPVSMSWLSLQVADKLEFYKKIPPTTVVVAPGSPPEIRLLTATPQVLKRGSFGERDDETELLWQAVGVTSCKWISCDTSKYGEYCGSNYPLTSRDWKSVRPPDATEGILRGTINGTSVYTLQCIGEGGEVVQKSVEVAFGYTPVKLTANPASVTNPGDETTLTWSSLGADSCTGSSSPAGWSTSALNGEQKVRSDNTTYTLVCQGRAGSSTRSITVEATSAPAIVFTVSKSLLEPYELATFTWDSPRATSCTFPGHQFYFPKSGAIKGTHSESPSTGDYVIWCTIDGVQKEKRTHVVVRPSVGAFTATPKSLKTGQNTKLAWTNARNSKPCVVTDDHGWSQAGFSTEYGDITRKTMTTTTYTLTCTGEGGSATKSVKVTVTP